MCNHLLFGNTVTRKLSRAHPFNPFAEGTDLQIAAKRLKRNFFSIFLSFKHVCDGLPLLPDFVFVDHTHVTTVLLSIVVFDGVDFI